ncbi:MAG: MFS transporter [Paracoccaceae bacterium]
MTTFPQVDRAALNGRWAISALFFANGSITGGWAPQIPLLLPRHQITESTLGLIILFFGIGAVIAMVGSGRLIATYGSRNVARAFAIALMPMLPLVVLAPSLPILAVIVALLGGLMGAMDVAMNANAVGVEDRLGRAAMSSFHGFWSLGAFFGSGFGGWVVAQTSAMTGAIMSAGVGLAIILAALPHVIEDDSRKPADDTPHDALIPRDLGLLLLGMIALFSMIPEGAVMDWAAIFLQKELDAAQAVSTLGFAFFAAMMAIMRFAGDAVRNRFGAVRTLRVSALIAAAGFVAAVLAPNATLAIAGFAFAGIGVANMVPIAFSAAGNYPGYAQGTGIAFVAMLGYMGILVAPFSIGYIAEHFGFRLTFAGLITLLVIVALMANRAASAERQTSPAT